MANCEVEMQKIKHLYHSLESVLSVLQRSEFAHFEEVKNLLSLFSSYYRQYDDGDSKQNKVFIVLEGLDGSGKTTVCKELAKALHGVRCCTPPTVVQPLRPKFDAHPPILRRAFYALGNYMAAKEIQQTVKCNPVILDRFWHSTAVFTIATELEEAGLGQDGLPPPGDPIYRWPFDLKPVPDVVFYLDVKEHIRSERLSRRKLAVTDEEKHMGSSLEFRNLLKETYHRMADPPVTVIDSNQPVKCVVNDILNFMKDRSLIKTEIL